MGAKKNLLYLILLSAILLVGVIYSPPFAYADDNGDDNDRDEIICENTTLRGIIRDNVRVPEDSRCLLKAFVQGDIFLEENSLLDAYDSTIEGNIKGPDTSILLLNDSTLKGDIHVDGDIGIDGVGFDSLSVVGNIKSKGSECVIIIDAFIKGNANDDDDDDDKAKVDLKKKTFVAISNTIIDGDVKIKETDTDYVICEGGPLELRVKLVENNISGNVDVEKSSNEGLLIISNDIDGSLDVKDNSGKITTIESNVVGKDLKVEENTSETTIVESNVVGKDLKVEENKDVLVTNNSIGKKLDIEENKTCSHSNNKVSGKSKIKDCEEIS